MGDIESSDDELHDIIAEYEEKAKENQLATVKQEPSNNNDESTTIKKEPPTKRIKKKKHIKKEKNLSVETPMDKVIFGDKRGLLRNLARAVGQEESSDEETKGKEKIRINEVEVNGGAKKRKPAWTDADDEEIQFGDIKRETRFTGPIDHIRKDKSYKEYLATRYSKIVPQPKWASLEKKKRAENSDDDDDGLLRTVGFLAKPAGDVLQPKHIYIKQLKDLNRATYCENGITGVQFHPTSTAALVTSHSGKASIYSIDGDANEKLHTVHFNKFSVLSARIMPCGTKAIFGSKQRYYYKYDLLTTKETYCSIARDLNCTSCRLEVSPCGRYMLMLGRFGEFHLFTTNSNEVLHTFKQDHKAIDVCFTSDSERIICKDDSANVNIFSLRQRRLQHSFIDDGCIKGNKLALSPDQRMLATGSMEGVVNVYDFEKVQHAKAPLPEKAFMNLRTEISALQFNHTSELLAMCSRKVPNAVKLAHFPSATIYENFPINNADMEHIQALQFSPHSGYLALGNNKRRVPLFRIKHFNNY